MASTTSHPSENNSSEPYLISTPTADELSDQLRGNSAEFKGALSAEAYFRRENFLLTQDLTRDNGLTPWALVQGPESSRKVLASCETIRKSALVARNGTVTEVIAHGVGSVFCPPELRGRGYAGTMIRLLGERLKEWQQTEKDRVMFSVLWSDIGKKFYAKHGWVAFPSAHVHLAPWPGSSSSRANLPVTQPVDRDGLVSLSVSDQRTLKKRMERYATEGRDVVALVPDLKTIRWHHAREEFVAMELYGKKPEVRGAVVNLDSGKRVWCFWSRMWYNPNVTEPKGNTLHIIRLATDDVDYDELDVATDEAADKVKDHQMVSAIASLLVAAQSEASQWNIGEVEVWNPTSLTLAATRLLDPSAKVAHRDLESVASLRWYGDGSPGSESAGNLQWIGNEKYGWC